MNLSSVCGVCMSIMYVSPKSVCRKDLGYKGYEPVTFAFFAADVLLRGWNVITGGMHILFWYAPSLKIICPG